MPSRSALEPSSTPTARLLTVLVAFVAAVVGAACAGNAPAPTTAAPTAASATATYPPVQITVEPGVSPQQTLEEWTRALPVVVVGTITEVKPARWSTPDSARPTNHQDVQSVYTIFTDYMLATEQWVKGGAGRRNLIVRTNGGQVDQDRIVVEDEPTFTAGERVLLMLRPGTNPQFLSVGGPYYVPSALGSFPVKPDDTVTADGRTHKLDEFLARLKDWAGKRVLVEVAGTLERADDWGALSRASELIVIGTVQSERPSRWNTPDRRTPPTAQRSRYLIFTDYVIRTDRVLKAPAGNEAATGAEVIVRVVGGAVESDALVVPEEAELTVGERVLLMLKRDTLPDTKEVAGPHYRVANGRQGKWRIAGAEALRDVPGTTPQSLAGLDRQIQQANGQQAR